MVGLVLKLGVYLCKIYSPLMVMVKLKTMYEAVPCMRPGTACSTAELPENMERNRFGDVLPYDATRVALRPSRDNPTGYINASHIKRSKVRGLISQGPLPHTSHEFWQMVWEQAVCWCHTQSMRDMLARMLLNLLVVC
uniref:Tyrosine-protein phosphatase domain-containing protein n=1 Tax=Eptatretus burgeri TaxID=7764 RepID=A0A8C4WYW6_EPTBU